MKVQINRVLGIMSLLMTPIAIVFGIMATILLENVEPVKSLVRPYMPMLTRVVVFTMMAFVGSGIFAGIAALIRNDKPRWLPMAGLVSTLGLIIIFHFIAVGPNGD